MTLKSILIKMWKNAKKDCEEKVFDLQEKEESKNILCLGCSIGDIALSAAREVGTNDVYGIDIQPKFLKEASMKGINVIAADLNKKFPIKDNSFGVVVSDQVIEHLTDVDNFVKEIFSVHGFSVARLIGGGYYPCPEFLMKIMSKIDPIHSQFLIIKVRKRI